jgi:hypothetical protein
VCTTGVGFTEPRRQGEVGFIGSGPWVDVPALVSDHRAVAVSVASVCDVSADDLTLQLLLHLPRFLPRTLTTEVVSQEADRLAQRIHTLAAPLKGWLRPPSKGSRGPRNLSFGTVDEAESRQVLERLHYLHSARSSSHHLGLRTDEGQLAALLCLSELDIPDVARMMPEEVSPASALVVSRVYVFPWAPFNTVSYLLSRTTRWLSTEMPRIQALVTYVNPNMGFTGASYRSANWVEFGNEGGTRYAYIDGWYVTDRALSALFGTSSPIQLNTSLGPRFEVTRIPLQPLSVYIYFLNKKLRRRYEAGFQQVLRRPQ